MEDVQAAFMREALPQLRALKEFAITLCKDEQRAADLVQDTMLRAFRAFSTYRPGTNCRAWLFQICKHCFINDRRRKKLEPIAVDFDGEASSDEMGDELREVRAVAAALHEGGAGDGIMGDEVMRALEELPVDYHTVLILSDIEGYSYEEVAEFTRAPLGTVRSRIHRARRMLASRLRNYAYREGYLLHAA
jgi:RNA polymerase sigma-70 factor (ECF subfamily)